MPRMQRHLGKNHMRKALVNRCIDTDVRLAAGASIGMEDTAIMSKLLGKVESVSEVETAFKVFTNARIGRARTLLENSRRSAFNMVEGARVTPEELREADSHLQDFLKMDLNAHVAQILDVRTSMLLP